jgi:glycosyltransferase involved in cell wall biosynthesis
MTTIGIIAPYYNDAAYVDEMLESIDAPAQVVVVNDNTPFPDAQEKLDEISDLDACWGFGAPWVCEREVNGGFGAAMNTGLEFIDTADYLTPIGSDDAFAPGWLRAAQHLLDENPHLDLVSGWCVDFHTGRRDWFPKGQFSLDDNDTACGGATLIRRRVFEKLRYDETMTGYQDWDFFNRCLLEGFRFAHLDHDCLRFRRKPPAESLLQWSNKQRLLLIEYMRAKYRMVYPEHPFLKHDWLPDSAKHWHKHL